MKKEDGAQGEVEEEAGDRRKRKYGDRRKRKYGDRRKREAGHRRKRGQRGTPTPGAVAPTGPSRSEVTDARNKQEKTWTVVSWFYSGRGAEGARI